MNSDWTAGYVLAPVALCDLTGASSKARLPGRGRSVRGSGRATRRAHRPGRSRRREATAAPIGTSRPRYLGDVSLARRRTVSVDENREAIAPVLPGSRVEGRGVSEEGARSGAGRPRRRTPTRARRRAPKRRPSRLGRWTAAPHPHLCGDVDLPRRPGRSPPSQFPTSGCHNSDAVTEPEDTSDRRGTCRPWFFLARLLETLLVQRF